MAAPDDVIGADEARELLGVTEEQIDVLVEEGILTRVERDGRPGFLRAEVEAARLQGG